VTWALAGPNARQTQPTAHAEGSNLDGGKLLMRVMKSPGLLILGGDY